MNFMRAGFRPLSLEDSEFIPTACVNSPSFVKRNTSAMIIIHIAAMYIGVGSGEPGMKLPNQPKLLSFMTGS